MIHPLALLSLMILACWGLLEVCRYLDRKYRKAHGGRP